MKKSDVLILKKCYEDVIWMAIRYAHGRHTYAPSMVRESVENFKKIFPGWELKYDPVIHDPEADWDDPVIHNPDEYWNGERLEGYLLAQRRIKGAALESDYLYDLFDKPKGSNK